MIQTTLAAQSPTQCNDPVMTSWMLNAEGQNPCVVFQDVMRVCEPVYNLDWLTPSYSCDNEPGSITAACCCGSPTFALMSACWSCQYNYTMDIVTTTFTTFEKDCASVPNPLTSYDPIISSQVSQIDIPLWAKIEPMAGKWDLEGAWKNATPVETTAPPIPTEYPTAPSSTGLSSAAIIGIIVGSVFGTAIMFLITACVLWKCLNLGRYRAQPDQDIRVGQDMGYLDGEYVYVQPVNPEGGIIARRFTQRRGTRPRLEIDLDASDYARSNSRNPSDYEDDPGHPLRRFTPSPSYLGPDGHSQLAPDGRSYLDTEPPSPYSPARHASLDGKYRGYHPGASPQSAHRQSIDLANRDEREEYRISIDRSPVRQSRDRPLSGQFTPSRRPISGQFSSHRVSGYYSSHRASGQYSSHRASGQYDHRHSGSGQFRASGSPYRTSADRRRDHRVSVRSGLRPASFDSGDGGGRFMRIEDQRPSMDGARFGKEGRLSRDDARRSRDDGPRYSRDGEPRFSRDGGPRYSRDDGPRYSRDGGPRYSRDDGPHYSRDDGPRFSLDGGRRSRGGGRFSRDEYRKPSLSEGEEDQEDADTGEGPRTTGSDFNHHMGHLRKRSQSARTSCDPGHEMGLGLEMEPTEELPVPASAPPTVSKDSSSPGDPGPSKGRALRVANRTPEPEEAVSRPTSVMREPGLLARARTLMHVPTPKSTRSAASSTHALTPNQQGAAPPSAWQRLRNIPSVLSLSAGRRSSTESDATSAYHTAQGHPTPAGTGSGGAGTPVTEFGVNAQRTVRAESALGQVPVSDEGQGQARTVEGSDGYHQETDAGVQLVVEESGPPTPAEPTQDPPAYIEAGPSQPSLRPRLVQFDSSSVGHSDPDTSSAGGHFPRDSGNWDSTASSAMLQTWETARRPTGFVGTGRVVPGVRETGAEQEVMWNPGEALSSRSAVVTFDQGEGRRSGPGAPDRRQ
ncbi:stress response protein NST1 [Ceratobasidium sp. AG-Ba]|nr:stress response protein NST1 [Ceratobasidium sp. AG-Ba]